MPIKKPFTAVQSKTKDEMKERKMDKKQKPTRPISVKLKVPFYWQITHVGKKTFFQPRLK
jgi:hypothetical protein